MRAAFSFIAEGLVSKRFGPVVPGQPEEAYVGGGQATGVQRETLEWLAMKM